MNLSDNMVAHLNELLYSMNMLYQSNLKEQGHESTNLRVVITSLYEFIKNKNLDSLNKSTKEVNNMTQNILETLNKNKFIGEFISSNEDEDFKKLFMQGMSYSYGKMCQSLCDVIISQRYFLQYYSMEDFEANTIKDFLKQVSLFLENFLQLILPA